jgi:hypothetical protein
MNLNYFPEDVNVGRIFYVLNPASNATDDTFFFKLRDKGTINFYKAVYLYNMRLPDNLLRLKMEVTNFKTF